MLFRGVSDNHWPLKELSASFGEKDITEYVLQLPEFHTNNDNVRFNLLPKPSPSRAPAKYIVLADIPATPIPQYTLKMIRQAVKNGVNSLFSMENLPFRRGNMPELFWKISFRFPSRTNGERQLPCPMQKFTNTTEKIPSFGKMLEKGLFMSFWGML